MLTFIDQIDWFDYRTKAIAKQKVMKITKLIGFPPWILFDQLLDLYYNLDDDWLVMEWIEDDNYLKTLARYRSMRIRSSFERITKNPRHFDTRYSVANNDLISDCSVQGGQARRST